MVATYHTVVFDNEATFRRNVSRTIFIAGTRFHWNRVFSKFSKFLSNRQSVLLVTNPQEVLHDKLHGAKMVPVDAPSFENALEELCDPSWLTEHAGTRRQEVTLLVLLPVSRTDEGRRRLGEANGAIANIIAILKDPLIFHNDVGAVVVRLLRNLCARCPENQVRSAAADAHNLVLECVERHHNASNLNAAVRRVNTVEGMRLPFFGFAIEFLVNFVTGNPDNAAAVWDRAFPSLFTLLLECDNKAATSAAAALVHNCIVVLPDRITDVVKIWAQDQGTGRSLAQSILQLVNIPDCSDGETDDIEKFTWSFLVVKRLVEAGLLTQAFNALGPPLVSIVSSKDQDFRIEQKALLGVLDAAIGKSAERPSKEALSDVRLPDDSLPFICELLESAAMKGNGLVIRLSVSISGSAIIMCPETAKLASVKMSCAKVGVSTLKLIAKQKDDASLNSMIKGLRASSVRAIALACDRYKPAQDLVRNLAGIPLILNALSYESDPELNPFLREWAIIAVRNLCYDNQENASEISSYELQEICKDQDFLNRTGLEAYLDKLSGQTRVRVRSTN